MTNFDCSGNWSSYRPVSAKFWAWRHARRPRNERYHFPQFPKTIILKIQTATISKFFKTFIVDENIYFKKGLEFLKKD